MIKDNIVEHCTEELVCLERVERQTINGHIAIE